MATQPSTLPADDAQLPHRLTIIGHGTPANIGVAVSGEIEMIGASPTEEATIITDGVLETAVADTIQRFRFSGELLDSYVAASDEGTAPSVHVDENCRWD